MNGASSLAGVISGEFSREGVLLRADDALLQLHIRAGGAAGEIMACPALLRLTQLAGRLQMRLARAVRVSDGADNLELWVEAEPVENNVRLAIQSWRKISDFAVRSRSPNVWPEQSEEPVRLGFDKALRLVDARGPVGDIVKPEDFGTSFSVAIDRIFGPAIPPILKNIEKFLPIGRRTVSTRSFDNTLVALGLPSYQYVIWGQVERHADGEISGYTLFLTKSRKVANLKVPQGDDPTSGALFGKQLAPVLRHPLNRIIANAETIGSELLGPIRENYAAYARDIAGAARHLTALVEDLGDLEAVERPGFSTAKDDIELGDVARRAAGLLALKAADHSITLVVPDEQTQVPATAEFRRALQVMLNLITNAIRYSPDGTEVHVEVGAKDGVATISVTDQGAGVGAENYERIFAKFERLGRTGDGGSGLGLYISRRLARAMGGDLTVEAAKGGGAKFTLRLPQ